MRITVSGPGGALKAVYDLALLFQLSQKVEEQVDPGPVLGEDVYTLQYLTPDKEEVEWVYNGEKVDLNDGTAEYTVS